MGFGYFNFCSYWKNLTSPLTCWHRGTAFQFDVLKDNPQRQVVLTELGTDVVLVTMAARIVQSMISLGKNLLQKRVLYWKIHPRFCMIKPLQAALWVCCSILDLLLPLLMTVYIYKNRSRLKAVSETEPPMKKVTIKCHWGSQAEPARKMVLEEFCKLEMETIQETVDLDCQGEQMDGMVNGEVPVPSCRNPVILSMICVPSEDLDSSESDMESEGSSIEEEMSGDSGVHESLTPKSTSEENCDEESDWSDDDSWDEESNVGDDDDDDDLWASFCRSDDPYNPLSFAMPTRASQPKKEAPTKRLETNRVVGDLDHMKVVKTDCDADKEKQKKLCKKPVLSGYKSPHKCSLLEEAAREDYVQGTKKVRFSPKVIVHPIITWSFAHRMARKGPWEEYARDRSRFQRRIAETEAAIGFCLKPPHREKIWARLQTELTF